MAFEKLIDEDAENLAPMQRSIEAEAHRVEFRTVHLEVLPEPDWWLFATYFEDLVEAVASFRDKAGLGIPLDRLVEQVRLAEAALCDAS